METIVITHKGKGISINIKDYNISQNKVVFRFDLKDRNCDIFDILIDLHGWGYICDINLRTNEYKYTSTGRVWFIEPISREGMIKVEIKLDKTNKATESRPKNIVIF